MQIQVASDLHLEFFTDKDERKRGWSTLLTPSAPVLVLAGDICQATSKAKLRRLARFLGWCSLHYETVLYVPGNHEFYNIVDSRFRHLGCDLEQALQNLRDACALFKNVFLLCNETKIIDNVCFIGATLWTALPTPEAQSAVQEWINDFECIHEGVGTRLTPQRYAQLHLHDRAWIERQLEDPAYASLKKVVVSHHAPSYLGVCDPDVESIPDFDTHEDYGACCYGSALGDLVALADAWIFGHTHYCVNTMRGDCRLVANQRGYKDDLVDGYDPTFSFSC